MTQAVDVCSGDGVVQFCWGRASYLQAWLVGDDRSVSFSDVQISLFPGSQLEFQPFFLALGSVQLLDAAAAHVLVVEWKKKFKMELYCGY